MAIIADFINASVIENSPAGLAMAVVWPIADCTLYTEFPFVKAAETADISAAEAIAGYAAITAMPMKDAEVRRGINALLAFLAEKVPVVGSIACIIQLIAVLAMVMLARVADAFLAVWAS